MNKIYKYYLFPILLILFVWLAYYPICSNDFINFDDQVYVTLNPNVNTGLTKANIEWAFKTNKCSNWHPLTWLSHMTDCQLFGLNAGKHHLVSLTIHTLVVLLLYIFLCIATSAFIPAFIVAILFAIHPVHTESVIWISERKDLLCALFFYLSLISYSLYVKNKNFSKRFYSIALLSFILGLLSKPMIVSLPIILFLLDFWPFERINFLAFTQKTHFIEKTVEFIKNNRKLIYEKIPFIILSAISCIVTFLVQRSGGAVRSLKAMPLFVRFPSSLVAYATYLKKLLFPQEFAIFYPHSSYNISFGKILISFIVLVAITILILWKRKKQKQLLTGWLWFIVMLIPVIGIIQVGGQALADRYMYLPAVGIYLILTWIIKEYIPQLSTNKNFPPLFLFIIIMPFILKTRRQVYLWKNSETLFNHTYSVTEANYIATDCLGCYYMDQDQDKLAEYYFNKTIEINPRKVSAYYNLGKNLVKMNKINEAQPFFRQYLKFVSNQPEGYNAMADIYIKQNNLHKAEKYLLSALELDEKDTDALYNLSKIYMETERYKKAKEILLRMKKKNPTDANVTYNLALTYLKSGKYNIAISLLKKISTKNPKNAETLNNLAYAYMKQKKYQNAEKYFLKAISITPKDPEIYDNLGQIFFYQGKPLKALKSFENALKITPKNTKLHASIQKNIDAVKKYMEKNYN